MAVTIFFSFMTGSFHHFAGEGGRQTRSVGLPRATFPMSARMNSTRKTKKRIWAASVEIHAMLVNPKRAASSAMSRKAKARRNISGSFVKGLSWNSQSDKRGICIRRANTFGGGKYGGKP